MYWARFLSFSLRLVREASSQRWQSYGCDPSMSLASTSFHKPALFLGDLGGTFREERARARERRLRGKMSVARHADNATCDLFPPSGMTAYQKDWLAIFSSKRVTFLRRYITRGYIAWFTKGRTLSVHSFVRVMTGWENSRELKL